MKQNIRRTTTIALLFVFLFSMNACKTEIRIQFVTAPEASASPEAASGNIENTAPTTKAISTAPAAAETQQTAAPQTEISIPAQTEQASAEQQKKSAKPETTEEILSFYRAAVMRVKNGEAGYAKKTWETASSGRITGIQAVDGFINTEVQKRATAEADAQETIYAKNSQEAIQFFPACTLTDISAISSASCTQQNNHYEISIIMKDEDTPETVNNSTLGKITDIILFKNEIDRELAEKLSAVKNPVYNVVYKGFEVTCAITPDGEFLSLQHHAYADVTVTSVEILLFQLQNASASITMDAAFSNFQY